MFAHLIAIVLAVILTVLGLLYGLWATGSTFPAGSEEKLARMVVGRRAVRTMPSRSACLFVALCLFAAAVLALMLGRIVPMPVFGGAKWVMALIGGFAAMMFLGRGVLGVLPAYERAAPEQPFLRLNRRIYSPLSFLIGVGFVLLTLSLPYWSWRLGLLG